MARGPHRILAITIGMNSNEKRTTHRLLFRPLARVRHVKYILIKFYVTA